MRHVFILRELLVVFLETPYGAPHEEHSWFWPVALKCDRGRAKTQPPGAGCPCDVRDELLSKGGVSSTEY